MARVRSPNYPAISLPEAIARVREVHKVQQSTPEPREVVIQHMGYSGVNGRSLKALSALIKYGLLESVGDDGLRVSARALAILFPNPDTPNEKGEALLAAAHSPTLFATIFDRWKHRPTEESLKAFLVREGFNTSSFDQVARAFYDTFDLVSDLSGSYDSGKSAPTDDIQDEDEGMQRPQDHLDEKAGTGSSAGSRPDINSTKPVFDFETVEINTKIDNQEDLAELLLRLEKIKSMLPSKDQD